tara:strand:- start:610 stop:1293 length:684 start_codon:yes stop_codon:yes gene_type:complete
MRLLGTDSTTGIPGQAVTTTKTGTTIAVDVNVISGSGDAVTIADGADVVEGSLADAANTTGTTGTVNGKLRGIVQLLASCISIGSNWMQVSIQNATLAVTQSGTWGISASTTGGSTPYSYIAAAAANQDSTIVKASAGQLYAISAISVIGTLLYLKVYNKATGPTSSDTPLLRFPIPASTTGAGYTFAFPEGAAFSAGISFRITTGIADSNTGAATANDCIVNLIYK